MRLIRILVFATAFALSLFASAIVASADPGRPGSIVRAGDYVGIESEDQSPGDPGGGP